MQITEFLEGLVVFGGLVCVAYATNELLLRVVLISVFMLAAIIQSVTGPEDVKNSTNWKFRQKASAGLVTGSLLLPMAFMAHGTWRCSTDGMPWTCSYPLMTLTTSICLLSAVTIGRNIFSKLNRVLSPSYLLVAVLVGCYSLLKLSSNHQAAYVICGGIMSMTFLSHLMTSLPDSFSVGEAMLVAQWLTVLTTELLTSFPGPVSSSMKFGACLQVLFVGSIMAGFLLRPIYHRIFKTIFGPSEKRKSSWTWDVYFYLTFVIVNIAFLLPWLGVLIQENPVVYGLKFMFASENRIWLMIGWIILVTVAIAVITVTSDSSTVVRKYFHLIAVATFLPGLVYDPELICLASAGVFFIALFLEGVRVLRIKPFGDMLHDAAQVFVDERDTGPLVLSHIYLLVGLSLPIWISSSGRYVTSGLSLPLFSGVLAIGVGDTAASVIGSQFGRCKWPGTKKTVEGTLAAIISQAVFCQLLEIYLGIMPVGGRMVTLAAVILTSLLEAFTDQIDNLILPIFMFSILSVKL